MKILLSNDDGVHALGIKVLQQELIKHFEVTVVAPDRNCSGASNSLTLLNPLRAHALDNGFISVNGTPTDSVSFAGAVKGFCLQLSIAFDQLLDLLFRLGERLLAFAGQGDALLEGTQ